MLAQHRFHLTRFDPVAADLHLLIGAPQVLERSISSTAGQIARAIHPGPRVGTEWIGNEPPGGQLWSMEIPVSHPGSTHAQFARHPDGDRFEPGPQHPHLQIGNGDANQAGRLGLDERRSEWLIRDMHRGLGDSVHVEQAGLFLGIPGIPGSQPGERQFLATEDDGAKSQSPVEFGGLGEHLEQLHERRRGLIEHGDAILDQQGQELAGRAGHGGGHHHQPTGVQQGSPHLPDREIKCRGMKQRPGISLAELEPGLSLLEQAEHIAVGHHHTIGLPSGTRRVDDIRRGVGGVVESSSPPGRCSSVLLRQGRLVLIEVETKPGRLGRKPLSQPPRGHHTGGLGVVEDLAQPGGG